VRDIHHTLANAAFDADLLGAWNKLTRPCVFENQGGQSRFGLPQSRDRAYRGIAVRPRALPIRRCSQAADLPPGRVDELADRNRTPVVQQQRGECRACCAN
jgi:hypothetical protein